MQLRRPSPGNRKKARVQEQFLIIIIIGVIYEHNIVFIAHHTHRAHSHKVRACEVKELMEEIERGKERGETETWTDRQEHIGCQNVHL